MICDVPNDRSPRDCPLIPRVSGLNDLYTRQYGGSVWKSNPCGVLILCDLLIVLWDKTTKTESLGYNLATIPGSFSCPLLPPIRLLRRRDLSPGRSRHPPSLSLHLPSTQYCDRRSNPLKLLRQMCVFLLQRVENVHGTPPRESYSTKGSKVWEHPRAHLCVQASLSSEGSFLCRRGGTLSNWPRLSRLVGMILLGRES
jgi:hypothetical protein